MSKSNIKKFRKNDWSYDDDEENSEQRSNYLEKKKQKKVDRALRTKDIKALLEEDEDETGFEQNYSTFEEEDL
jgi:hypothetical protein